MKIAYLDCGSGISGDMMLGALVDAGADMKAIETGVRSLGLGELELKTETVKKKGFRALQLSVNHPPEHAHRHLHHIEEMIDRSNLEDRPKDLAKRIFRHLGEAEAKVHGTTLEKVHFHEVGAIDSIADIVGTAIACHLLDIEEFACSPVPTGQGKIIIAHGEVSVPAPATAELLRGVPLAPSAVKVELTTPTGAAIVATMVSQFGPLPAMSIDAIGYGAGDRDLEEQANLLRILIGIPSESPDLERLWMVETNLDDSPGEFVGHALAKLWEIGVLDAVTSPVAMKKGRPGVTLSVLCQEAEIPRVEEVLFRETTTLGIKRWPVLRRRLRRETHHVATPPWGEVSGTLCWPDGVTARFAPEYESCLRVANEHGVPLPRVYEEALRAFNPSQAVSPNAHE